MKRIIVVLLASVSLLMSCSKDYYERMNAHRVQLAQSEYTKTELIKAAGTLYDESTDSFSSGTITVVIIDNSLNRVKDLVCRYSAKYTTTDKSVYPYIQVYYNNPPLNNEHNRMRYKIGAEGESCYGECKCITNGKTTGFTNSSWNGDYIIKITIPKGVTLCIDSFIAGYDNSFINKDSFRVMQHGRIFNASMDCETNWQGWSHVGNYGAIVVPKRTTDGVWVCYHDDKFGDNPRVQVIGKPKVKLPGESIQTCTYAQILTLEYISENSFGFHDRIPKLESFFEYCVKTGVHPVFSIHPNWTVEEWAEIKELVEKYNLLDKLNIKGGYSTEFINKIYNLFGSDIESFLIDLATETQPTSKQINALASKDWDLSRIKVGFEYMSNAGGYFNDDNLNLMRQNGLVHGIYIIASESNPLNAEFIKDCIKKGCYELCADYFFSNGLNW